jgi:ribosomal protein S27E
MQPLYLARIEDLGRGDFVKVDCTACHHVALLTSGALLKLGLRHAAKVLDLKERVRCRGCGVRDEPSFRSSGRARAGELPLTLAPPSARD